MTHLTSATETLSLYTQAISRLNHNLNDSFNHAIEMILNCEGRVVVAGIGKSGLVGKKNGGDLCFNWHAQFFLTPH